MGDFPLADTPYLGHGNCRHSYCLTLQSDEFNFITGIPMAQNNSANVALFKTIFRQVFG